MADVSIDKLSIEITANTNPAIKSIDKLISSIEKLNASAAKNSGVNKFCDSLKQIEKTLNNTNFEKLNQLKDIKVSATLGSNLVKFSSALDGLTLQQATKLRSISSALKSLSDVGKITISTTTIKRIKELFDTLNNYRELDMRELCTQFDTFAKSLARVAPRVKEFANAISKLPRSYRTAASSARTVEAANKALGKSFDTSTASLKSSAVGLTTYFAKVSGVVLGLNAIKDGIMNFVDKSNSYIENMNLFTASMGSGAEAALEFAEKAQNLMGIDLGEWARNQGVFQTLITGMGETSEHAEVMSQQLTQLGYDIASFYNMKVDDAMLKIQSGIAGELEPLRRIGWDLSDARMQIEVDDMGLEASTQKMSQAEKVALRYKMIMEQVTIVHGDMARTIASPANQLRVLQAQLEITARTIGDLFIPALNAILPWVIAIVKAVRILAIEIAKFFGIDATFEVDYSTLDTSGIASAGDSAADSLDDANESAKELKNTVMGFDELNKLSAETDSSKDNGKNGAGVGLDLDLPTYDFFEGLTDMMSQETDKMAKRIVEQFKKILPIVSGIGAGILGWKLAPSLINGVSAIHDSFKKTKTHTKGIAEDLEKSKSKTKGIADDLEKVGKTSFPQKLALGFTGIGTNVKTLLGGLAGAIPLAAQIGIAVGVAAGYFVYLWETSAKFRSGVQNIVELIQGIDFGQLVKDIEKFFSEAISGIGGFISGFFSGIGEFFSGVLIDLNLPVPDLTPFAEFFEPLGTFLTDIGNGVTECFDLKWSDAFMVALTAITAFIPGVNVAVPIIIGLTEAVSLGIRAMGDCVVSVDALAGVSEETAERFGTSLESMEDAIGILDSIDFADAVVTQDDVDNISEKIADIENTILNNLDAERNKELAALDALKGLLPEEEIEEQKAKINQLFDDRAAAAQSGSDRIREIYSLAAADNRTITDDEAAEIRAIQSELQEELIASSGATKEEINKITAAMANNNEAAALQSSETILQAAIAERDARVQAGWDSYDAAMRAADGLLEAGEISQEQYDKIQQAALATAQAEQDAANEAYYGENGVVARVQAGLGDAANKIDTNTGNIKSGWDLFCENTGKSWQTFTDDMGKKAGEASEAVQNWWDGLPGFFDRELVQPLAKVADETWTGMSTSATQAGDDIQTWWNGLPNWFETEVKNPIGKAADEVWTGVCKSAEDALDDAQGAWSSAESWFQNNVTDPVSDFFSDAWNSISDGGLTSWFGVEKAWADSGDYFEDDVTDPIGDFFSDLWSNTQQNGKDAWSKVESAWDVAEGWFDKNVTNPVGGFFDSLWKNSKSGGATAWSEISKAWNGGSSWFKSKVTAPIAGFFSDVWGNLKSGAKGAWSGIKDVFTNVTGFFGSIFSDAWKRVCSVFTGSGSGYGLGGLGDSIIRGFKSIVNNLIRGINDVVSIPFRAVNDALSGIRRVDIMGARPFGWLPYITTPRIPYLATGGQVASGQLFVARENGIPELVGRMGGQATVANNQQIVDGIKQGVIEAMISVMSLNEAGGNSSDRPVEVVLRVGNDDLARATYKGFQNLERRGEISFGY